MSDVIRKIAAGITQAALIVGAIHWWDEVKERPLAALIVAMIYELCAFVLAFGRKVWLRLEEKAVQDVADRVWTAIGGFSPSFRSRYKEYITKEHGIFNVRGLGLITTYTLNLDRVFVDLRVAPSINPQRPNVNLVARNELAGNRQIWDFLDSGRGGSSPFTAFAIIGPAGCGKTTLLQHVALTLASNRGRRSQGRGYIPILLFLRNYVEVVTQQRPPALGSIVQEYFERRQSSGRLRTPPGWFQKQLDRGKCFVLLDGLDEVADVEHRKAVASWVDSQIKNYPSCPFVVTARPQGYLETPLDTVDVLEVQPLNVGQVRRFVQNWYLENEIRSSGNKFDQDVHDRATRDANDLLQRLRRAPALGELTPNPLLLTMIAMVHRYRGTLPESRAELYSEICQALLGRWRQARGLQDELSAAQKLLLLRPLASYMMEHHLRDITMSDAVRVIGPYVERFGIAVLTSEGTLKKIEAGSGLLLERDVGTWSFAHLTFQEYLTASSWAGEKGLVCDWIEMVSDSWWHETLRLYAAQADATLLARACLEANTFSSLTLAADCLEEARDIAPETRCAVEEWVITGLESDDAARRRLSAEVHLARRLKSLQPMDDSLSIDLRHITCAEYQLFLDDMRAQGQYYQPDHWTDYRFPAGEALNPVGGVRPQDAEAFCKWLDRVSGGKVAFRLPKTDEASRYPAETGKVATLCKGPKGFDVVGLSEAAKGKIRERLHNVSTSKLSLLSSLDVCRDLAAEIDNDLVQARNLSSNRATLAVRTSEFPLERGYLRADHLVRSDAARPDFTLAQLIGIVRDRTLTRDLIRDLDLSYTTELAVLLATNLAKSLSGHTYSLYESDVGQDPRVDVNAAVLGIERAVRGGDIETAKRNLQDMSADSGILETELGSLLVDTLKVALADSPFLARKARRKLVARMLELAHKGFEGVADSSHVPGFNDSDGVFDRGRQSVIQLYSLLEIAIAREEGGLPAWESIRVVRDSPSDEGI